MRNQDPIARTGLFVAVIAASLLLLPAAASAETVRIEMRIDTSASLDDLVVSLHLGSETLGMSDVYIPMEELTVTVKSDGYAFEIFVNVEDFDSLVTGGDWRFSARVDARDTPGSVNIRSLRARSAAVDTSSTETNVAADGDITWIVADFLKP